MKFLNVYVLCLAICLKDYICYPFDNYNNIYGEDYGTSWIFLPDGDGIPHYVNLRRYDYDNTLFMRGSTSMELEFRLYLGNDTDTYIILDEWAQPLQENIFDNITYVLTLSDKPLKILTHGWKSSVDKEGVRNIKDAYIESQKVNVITIDWSGIADSIFYHWVANETKTIGARVATFIGELHNQHNVSGDQIHLIGHSLGAHIMGIAAARSNFRVDRITADDDLIGVRGNELYLENYDFGSNNIDWFLTSVAIFFTSKENHVGMYYLSLDPARPLFEYPPEDTLEKLDSSDATFVDVIHTCSGILGFEKPIGTVDFYPNNGTPPQPGCESLQKIFEACSHGRSFLYFSESIKYPTAFPAYQCSSWFEYLENKCNKDGYMGEEVDRRLSGKYYLKTNPFQPFGLRFK